MNDESARARWTTLYVDAFPRVFRALAAALLDAEAARDALQDAFEEGLRHPPTDERNLPGWLYRVAFRKARRSLLRRPRSVPLTANHAAPDSNAATLEHIEVGRLLAWLTERQRAVVVAHYYLGLSHSDLADLLGISRGTVGATISQSVSRMRKGTIDVW
jgi:RNA polymerase sigma-70 factor (ECF subfamily)